MIVIEYALQM